MRVAPGPLLIVVRSGLVAGEQREEGHLVDHVPQRLVAGEAEVDDPLFTAAFRHGPGAGLRLQMTKRLPPSGGVPQAGPEGRRGDPVFTDREGPRPAPPAGVPASAQLPWPWRPARRPSPLPLPSPTRRREPL